MSNSPNFITTYIGKQVNHALSGELSKFLISIPVGIRVLEGYPFIIWDFGQQNCWSTH